MKAVSRSNLVQLMSATFVCWTLTSCIAPSQASDKFGGKPSASESRPAPKNILLILTDDMGFSDVGAFGAEVSTPNIDRLAFDGLRLTQFYTTAKCSPSRAALLTGQYPQQVGAGDKLNSAIEAQATFAESARAAGLRTFMVGKHHSTTHPLDLGFERYIGLRDGAADYFNPGTVARDGEPFPAQKSAQGRWWCFDRDCQRGWTPPQKEYYSTDAYTDWAIELMDSAGDDPFLMYIAYTAPHDPLQAPAADIARQAGRYGEGYEPVAQARWQRQVALGLMEAEMPLPATGWRAWDALTDAERLAETQRMQVYAAMIERLDANIGRLISWLDAHDMLDDTLIIFTSDNGASAELVLDTDGREIGQDYPIGTIGRWASLGEDWARVANTPWSRFKNYSHQGGTVVPAIIHWPRGLSRTGEIDGSPTHLIDIFPTLLALMNQDKGSLPALLEKDFQLEGSDLTPLMTGEGSFTRNAPIFNRWKNARMVRADRWKLVSWNPDGDAEGGSWELYDMIADPAETNDLAASRPEVAAELAAAYDAWIARVSAAP
jgi:arylsulfatase